jgi:hypothetical protein
MWCRDVHYILKLDSNVQTALVEFEQKCFKVSICIRMSIEKLKYIEYNGSFKIHFFFRILII